MIRIITVTYQNLKLLDKLTESLEKHVKVPYEFVIWDNSPSEVHHEFKKNSILAPHIHFLGESRNLGFAKGINRACEHSTSSDVESLLLLNPDAFLASDIDLNVIQQLSAQPGIIGLQVFNDSQKTIRQNSARSFPNFLTSITGREGLLTRLFPNNPWSKKYLRSDLSSSNFHKEQQVDWVSGCALFCSKKIWEKLNGFDEQFFLYVEDVDLGKKAQLLRIPVFYLPIVDVIHFSRTLSGKRPWKSDFHHHFGMLQYWWKWSRLPEKVLLPAVFLGISLRYAFRFFIGSKGRTST